MRRLVGILLLTGLLSLVVGPLQALAGGFVNLYPGSIGGLIDEWTIGFDFRNITIGQNERNITGKLIKRPEIDYFDYYDVSFDHISHHNNDTASRFAELESIDREIEHELRR